MTNPHRTGQLVRGFLAAACIAAASLVLPAAPASAIEIEGSGLTIAATPSATTNYMFRGISQTRNRPALQGTLDVQHDDTGLYIGAFVSNVSFHGSNASVELDGMFGYRREILGISFDLGGVYYAYPGSDTHGLPVLDYFEGVLKATKEIGDFKLMGTVAISPHAFGRSGTGVYAEGGVDIKLPFDFVGNLRIGHWNLQRNLRFGTPDYTWGSVGVTRELYEGITLNVTWSATDVSKRQCAPNAGPQGNLMPGGQHICGSTFLASLSRAF
jgi:uncharacterized protein (TIGR02001 family)